MRDHIELTPPPDVIRLPAPGAAKDAGARGLSSVSLDPALWFLVLGLPLGLLLGPSILVDIRLYGDQPAGDRPRAPFRRLRLCLRHEAAMLSCIFDPCVFFSVFCEKDAPAFIPSGAAISQRHIVFGFRDHDLSRPSRACLCPSEQKRHGRETCCCQ
ncbi:hypothetical protein F4777DRAFT_157893 [Nemania sp. FL0916]|nr:hypothetical protein F4777DRAFT_157893 [Nemania sp. FL0916]